MNLLIPAILALIIANSPFSEYYSNYVLSDWFKHFTNDFLMSIFFLLIGIEIKKEFLDGHLAEKNQLVLPLLSALFGVITPAMIYLFFTYKNPELIKGWAIPTATDIAFSLGIVGIFGKSISRSTIVFLTMLAVIDDLIAIIIIAVCYVDNISVLYLFCTILITLVLVYSLKKECKNILLYTLMAVSLWYFLFKSGIHVTIAGVIFGLLMLKPNVKFEHYLSRLVNLIVLPIFAFVNTGIDFSALSLSDIFSTLSISIVFGLFFGKQIGIFLSSYFLIKFGACKMPRKSSFFELYNVSVICGIGFTMSLLIAILVFESNPNYLISAKIGVLFGSLLSAIFGILYQFLFLKKIMKF